MTETLYFFRALDDKRAEVAKFVDGSERPTEVYSLYNGTCNCFGAMTHKVVCKHMKMYKQWVDRGKIPLAIDYDRDRYYNLGEIYGKV